MGIKTRFNPMGGTSGDKGNLSEWDYTTNGNQIILLKYIGTKVDVIVPKRNTILNTVNSSWGTMNGPLCNNLNIEDVNLQYVPFVYDSMEYAFSNCRKLVSVSKINQDVRDMSYTFSNCTNFNQNIQIPSTISTMRGAFRNCTNFNQNIQIPNAIPISHLFEGCSSLNQNIQIPYGISGLSSVFRNCTSLDQNIQIPSSVNDLRHTFENCTNLNQNIKINIGDSIQAYGLNNCFYNCRKLNQNILIETTNNRRIIPMDYMFANCINLNQAIQIPSFTDSINGVFADCTNLNQEFTIPSNVSNMVATFRNCTKLASNMYINSVKINNVLNCFNGTSLTKNIWLQYRLINNALTTTRNSFNSAGYIVGTGVGNSTINGCIMHDYVAGQGYPTYVGNGTHWLLNTYSVTSGSIIVTTPNSILNYPTAITPTTYKGNTTISSLHVNNTIIAGTSGVNIFRGMTACTKIDGIQIPNGITTMASMFYDDRALRSATSQGYSSASSVELNIPNTVTTLATCFVNDKNVSNFYLHNGFNITTLTNCFALCNSKAVNVRLESPNIATITNWFRSHSTSHRKNIYIYFKYSNGVATKTFNAFKAATYMGTSGNSTFANPSYNSTSNFYFYNIGVCPV